MMRSNRIFFEIVVVVNNCCGSYFVAIHLGICALEVYMTLLEATIALLLLLMLLLLLSVSWVLPISCNS